MFLKSKAETGFVFCICRFVCKSKPLKPEMAPEIMFSIAVCYAVFLF